MNLYDYDSPIRITIQDVRDRFNRAGDYTLGKYVGASDIALALHEAAHAVVAMERGHRVRNVTIVRHGAYHGSCEHVRIDQTGGKQRHIDAALIVVAPYAAMARAEGSIQYEEERKCGGVMAGSDLSTFTSALESLGERGDSQETRDRYAEQARDIIDEHRSTLDQVMYALLRYKTLTGADLRAIAGPLATRWEAHKPKPAPARSIPPLRPMPTSYAPTPHTYGAPRRTQPAALTARAVPLPVPSANPDPKPGWEMPNARWQFADGRIVPYTRALADELGHTQPDGPPQQRRRPDLLEVRYSDAIPLEVG